MSQLELRFDSELPSVLASQVSTAVSESSLSYVAKTFLWLVVRGVGKTISPKLTVKFRRDHQLIIVDCKQAELARLCRTSPSQFRVARAELERLGLVITHKVAGNAKAYRQNVYSVSLQRIINLPPASREEPISGVLIEFDGNPFGDSATSAELAPNLRQTCAATSAELAPNLRQTCAHVEHEHKTHDHVFFKDSEVSQSQVRFSQISRADIVKIRNGDSSLFAEYFADILRASWAKDCSVDRILLAGLFVHSLRAEIKDPGAFIHRAWKNRKKRPITLTAAEEDQARRIVVPTRGRDAVSGDNGSVGGTSQRSQVSEQLKTLGKFLKPAVSSFDDLS